MQYKNLNEKMEIRSQGVVFGWIYYLNGERDSIPGLALSSQCKVLQEILNPQAPVLQIFN